ncbi:hypothetical protein niasHS_017312 [Heterodera schachtii]|uniref:Uncharacterized protein n=1 Tax=Heterodera schachtii TaxID=97005 RepID=A0ABD2IA41_HETSC
MSKNEGQDHGNEQFTLPPPMPIDPHEKVVLCKVGAIAENRRGSVTREICPKEARHCFATSCYKKADDGQLHGVVWGCAQSDNANVCTKFEQNLNAILIKQVSCECLFGARGVDYSNQKMMVHHLFLPPTSSLTTSINAATRTTAATMAPETSTKTMEVITTAKMENDSIENGIVRPAISNLSIVVMLSFAVLVVMCQRIAI